MFNKQNPKKVYLIESYIDGQYQYKIGVSQDPKIRFKQHQVSNPNLTRIVSEFYSNYPYIVESSLKNRFSAENINGEWFALSKKDIDSFYSTCEKTEDNIKILRETSTL